MSERILKIQVMKWKEKIHSAGYIIDKYPLITTGMMKSNYSESINTSKSQGNKYYLFPW